MLLLSLVFLLNHFMFCLLLALFTPSFKMCFVLGDQVTSRQMNTLPFTTVSAMCPQHIQLTFVQILFLPMLLSLKGQRAPHGHVKTIKPATYHFFLNKLLLTKQHGKHTTTMPGDPKTNRNYNQLRAMLSII